MADKDIRFQVTAEDRFSNTIRSLKRDLSGVAQDANKVRENLAGGNASFAALAGGPLATITVAAGTAGLALRNLAQDLDAFNDAADATGDSVENISGLEQVALRTGANMEVVTTSMIKLNQALAGAKKDSPAAAALKAIGLSAAELRQMAPSEALTAIAKALQGYENNASKARIVQELFGKSLREVAPFLNDLAEAGQLNATVTAEQAKQAEIFNKQLAQLSTNSVNAGRSIASDLLPWVNRMFLELKTGMDTFGGFGSALLALGGQAPRSAVEGLDKYATRLNELDKQIKSLEGPTTIRDGFVGAVNDRALAGLKAERESVERYVEYYRKLATSTVDVGAQDPRELARRGRLPKQLPDITDSGGGQAKMTEAQRYLESLQKQAAQVQHLTEYETALAEVQSGRLDGLTPKLREQILAQAKSNDLAKQAYDAMTARVSAQTAAGKADNDRLAALEEGNRAMEREIQTIGLTPAALASVEQARISDTIATKEATVARMEAAGVSEQQLQLLYAEIDALKQRRELVGDKVRREADQAADQASTGLAKGVKETQAESIAKGILEGTRAGQTIMDTFWREVKAQAATQILTPIISPIVEAGNTGLGKLFENIAGALFPSLPFGSGINGGAPLPDILRGSNPNRANGGSVRAGHRYTVNENGLETFQPATDGVILNARQTAQRQAASGPTVHYAPVMHVNGDVSAQTVQLMQAMLARNNQQLLRSMRTGGQFAQA